MNNLGSGLEVTSSNLGANDVNEVKTIYGDCHHIPLATCHGERKNALYGEVLLINDNRLTTSHYAESVNGGGEESDECLSDFLLGHVSDACCSERIIYDLKIFVKRKIEFFQIIF